MFLKTKLFTIFLLFSQTSLLKANEDEDSPSIIIIGAGASGIAAASKLFQNGFKTVKILEAENRIGGRVYTAELDGNFLDLGGQWIHGEEGNVVFEMAWPLGLLEKRNRTRDYKVFDSSGAKIDEEATDQLYSFFREVSDNLDNFSKPNGNISKGDILEKELNNYMEKQSSLKDNKKGLLHLLNMFEMSDDSADSWYNVSITSNTGFHITGDYLNNWKKRGYSTILDIMMKRYPNPEDELPVLNNTLLNTEVTLIDYSDKTGKVELKTNDGKTYSADHVIFTCSLGVLKAEHSSLFKPSLSAEKQKTIEALGYGNVAKVYLSFDEPWWPNGALTVGFGFAWKDEDVKMLQNDPEKSWLLGLMGFSAVEHKPSILFGWISGKYAREMEQVSDEKIFKHCIEVLQRFVGNAYNITAPSGMIRSKWYSNKHFRGTYSYRSMRSEVENVWPSTLAKPIGETKPRILFAGEGTTSHHYRTVNGPIQTGWREADRIIKYYQESLNSSKVFVPSFHP